MKTFRQFLEARKVDPVKLGQRAARRFGQKMDFPGQGYETYRHKEDEDGDLVPKKSQHLPLRNYDLDKADEVHNRYMNVGNMSAMSKHGTTKTVSIKDLHATQPFVSTSRPDILTKKVRETGPVTTVTHQGKDYIIDGHHAALGAALRGEKTITTKHLDMDKL